VFDRLNKVQRRRLLTFLINSRIFLSTFFVVCNSVWTLKFRKKPYMRRIALKNSSETFGFGGSSESEKREKLVLSLSKPTGKKLPHRAGFFDSALLENV